MSAPADQAVTTSVGVSAPGMIAQPASRQKAIVSKLRAGLTYKLGAGSQTVPGGFSVEHRCPRPPGLHRRSVWRSCSMMPTGAGHRHRDFEDGQPTGFDCFNRLPGLHSPEDARTTGMIPIDFMRSVPVIFPL
jgi:hypothetical protein